jgi:putative phage-type endonuclease
MQLLDMEQGSEAWLKARLGIPTASRFKEIITPAKGERSKSYKSYLYELLAERMTQEREDSYISEWMQRGNLLEDAARSAYEFLHDVEVQQVGLVLNDAGSIGASPDGLTGEDGGLEIKCPKASSAVRYMVEDAMPDIYKPQVQGNLWITGRQWWDFVVYHPDLDLFVKRIYRDEAYIKKMAQHITAFTEELEDAHMRLIR